MRPFFPSENTTSSRFRAIPHISVERPSGSLDNEPDAMPDHAGVTGCGRFLEFEQSNHSLCEGGLTPRRRSFSLSFSRASRRRLLQVGNDVSMICATSARGNPE